MSLLWDNDSNYISLEGISVDEDLGDVEGLPNLLLNLIRGNILTLSELEDVLLSVDDLEGAVGQPLAWENENGVSRRGSGAA